jgi:hypothetical protein
MNSTTTRAIFLASMVFTCSAYASSDVNKCVAPTGLVTLTDEPCPDGTQTVKVISGPSEASTEAEPAAVQPSVAPQRFTVGRLPPRYVTLMKSPKPQRGLALDVATLRAAKLNMHLLDNAAQVLRSQRLASLQ